MGPAELFAVETPLSHDLILAGLPVLENVTSVYDQHLSGGMLGISSFGCLIAQKERPRSRTSVVFGLGQSIKLVKFRVYEFGDLIPPTLPPQCAGGYILKNSLPLRRQKGR